MTAPHSDTAVRDLVREQEAAEAQDRAQEDRAYEAGQVRLERLAVFVANHGYAVANTGCGVVWYVPGVEGGWEWCEADTMSQARRELGY